MTHGILQLTGSARIQGVHWGLSAAMTQHIIFKIVGAQYRRAVIGASIGGDAVLARFQRENGNLLILYIISRPQQDNKKPLQVTIILITIKPN